MLDKILKNKKWNFFKVLVTLVCGHFIVSTLIWFMYLILALYWEVKGDDVIWTEFYGALTPIVLLSITIYCIKVSKKRIMFAKLLLIFIIIISSLVCYKDISSKSYQLQIATNNGCQHLYFTWWWFQS